MYTWDDLFDDYLRRLETYNAPAAYCTSWFMAGLIYGLSRLAWVAFVLLVVVNASAEPVFVTLMFAMFSSGLYMMQTVTGWWWMKRDREAVERLERDHGYLEH